MGAPIRSQAEAPGALTLLQGWRPCFRRDLEGNSAFLRPGAPTLCSAGWRPAAVPKEPGRCHVGDGAGCAHGTDLWGSLDAITCGRQPAGMARLEASQEKAECPGTGKCLTAISCHPLVCKPAASPGINQSVLPVGDSFGEIICGGDDFRATPRGTKSSAAVSLPLSVHLRAESLGKRCL